MGFFLKNPQITVNNNKVTSLFIINYHCTMKCKPRKLCNLVIQIMVCTMCRFSLPRENFSPLVGNFISDIK